MPAPRKYTAAQLAALKANKGLLANPATAGAVPLATGSKKRKPTVEDLVRIAGDRS